MFCYKNNNKNDKSKFQAIISSYAGINKDYKDITYSFKPHKKKG